MSPAGAAIRRAHMLATTAAVIPFGSAQSRLGSLAAMTAKSCALPAAYCAGDPVRIQVRDTARL